MLLDNLFLMIAMVGGFMWLLAAGGFIVEILVPWIQRRRRVAEFEETCRRR
jgi:hypothetical protein